MRGFGVLLGIVLIGSSLQGAGFNQDAFKQFCENLPAQSWGKGFEAETQFKETIDPWISDVLETKNPDIIVDSAMQLGRALQQHEALWLLYLACGVDVALLGELEMLVISNFQTTLGLFAEEALKRLDSLKRQG